MPWWGKSSDSKESKAGSQPADSTSSSGKPDFDPNALPNPQKLPKGLQKIVDKADEDGSIFDDIAEGV